MDFFKEMARAILKSNYLLDDDLAVFLKVRFDIWRLETSKSERAELTTELNTIINTRKKIMQSIVAAKQEKEELGKFVSPTWIARQQRRVDNLAHNIRSIQNSLSQNKEAEVKTRRKYSQSRESNFISELKEKLYEILPEERVNTLYIEVGEMDHIPGNLGIKNSHKSNFNN